MEETIKLIGSGKVFGYMEEVPEVISTGSSYIFIFRKNDIALKLYRRDNEHWNKYFSDMSEGEVRTAFISKDYEWNHFYSPNIYLGLKQADIVDGVVKLSDLTGGDELIIEMKIINSSDFLINILNENINLSEDDFYSMGKQAAQMTKSDKLKPSTEKNFYEIMKERVIDLTSWAKNLPPLTEGFTLKLEKYIDSYVDNSIESFKSLTDKDFVAVIDCHSANAIYIEGKLTFVDVLLPKPLWRTSRVNENFFRIATDIFVLRGEKAYKEYKRGFMEVTSFENKTEDFDLIYQSALMLCVQTSYAGEDKTHQELADKYYSFVINKLK